MIELVLVLCLSASPGECHEERRPFGGGSVLACMVQGQLIAAQRVAERPTYTLRRWRCEADRPREERI